MKSPLLALARRHCLAVRPAVCVKPFVKDYYGVGYEFFWSTAHGHRRPSPKLIAAIRSMHARLFPGEPLPTPKSLGLAAPSANPSLN